MPIESVSPQLSFSLGNAGAEDIVYITTDPAVNKLTLAITTNTAATYFSAGQVVPPGEAPLATGSLLYLNLSSLQIPDEAFAAINCTATGWAFALYPGSIIGMAPTHDVTLQPGGAISISIAQLTLPTPPATPNANLNVSYFRVAPIAGGTLPQVAFFKVLLQAAPGGSADLHDAITCALTSPAYVCNTVPGYAPVSNNFTFALQPGAHPVSIPAGADTQFIVSFVYAAAAPGYGALTTPQRAGKIQTKQGQNASAWTITPNPDAENPSWTLAPPSGVPLIGTQAKAIVEFELNGVVTDFEPGPTLMYVQYRNVPGFADGAYYMVLNKIAHVVIDSLSVSPAPAVLVGDHVQVTISWTARNYTSLQLMPFYKDVTNDTSFVASLDSSTDITLIAVGGGGPNNRVLQSVIADVLPSINSFEVLPGAVYATDFPHDARFFWDVATNQDVLLVNDTTQSQDIVPKSGTTTKQVTAPGMWSLVPQDAQQLVALERKVLVQAFKVEGSSPALPFKPMAIAAAPTAQFVAAVNQGDNSVSILNTLNFSDYTPAIAVGKGPVDAVFSSKGDFLFVANGAGSSVSVIGVTYNQGLSQYQFAVVATLDLKAAPQRLALSPDAKYLFVTTIDSAGAGKLVVVSTESNAFAVKQTLTVGKNPAGIAVDPSGVQVYVANSGDNTVAVLGYSVLNDAFNFMRNIANLVSQPVDVAVTGPQGRTLLIACAGSNQLLVVAHDDTGSSPRQSLPLGNGPAAIATTSDRAYAFVVNAKSNTVTLVDCYRGVGNCKVLESAIPVGAGPGAIALAADNTGAFVANRSEATLTLLNLVNYQAENAAVTVGRYPTSVAASPDGSNVITWQNKLIISTGTGPTADSPGIYIYETQAGKVTQKLASSEVIQCLFSTATNSNKLYVLINKASTISVLETGQYGVELLIPVPVGIGGASRQPIGLAMAQGAELLYVVAKTPAGAYSLLVYSCHETTNKYAVVADIPVFTSASSANPVLLQCAPDGSHVFVLSTIDQKVWVVARNLSGQYQLNSPPVALPSLAKSMVASPDSSYLYVLTQQGQSTGLSVVDIKTLSVSSYPMPRSYSAIINLQQMCISPDGNRLFISDADIVGVRVMSTASRRIIQTLAWPQNVQYPLGIALLPDASALFLAGYNSATLVQINQITAS